MVETPNETGVCLPKEALENQRHSRDNGPVIADQDWGDGRQAAQQGVAV